MKQTLCRIQFIKHWQPTKRLTCFEQLIWFLLMLALLEPAFSAIFAKKNSSFRLPYQRPSSYADFAKELFNGSNGSASLVDCTWKKIFAWGMRVFCEWRHKCRTFRPPWPTLPGPERQPLGGSISLKFLLETRLQSESFDTLDDLLGFEVQRLWCKFVKICD